MLALLSMGLKLIFIIPVIISSFLIAELYHYSIGDLSTFIDVPRAIPELLFFDLRVWTFNLSECPINIQDLTLHNSCTNNLYPFSYPIFPLYILQYLGLTRSSHNTYGLFLGIFTIISFLVFNYSAINASSTFRQKLVILTSCSIALVSPPFRYLLERGQIDQFVLSFTSLLFSVFLNGGFRRQQRLQYILLLLSSTILSLIKIFPVTIIGFFAIIDNIPLLKPNSPLRKNFKAALPRLLLAALFICCVCILLPTITGARNAVPLDVDGHGYGLKVLIDAGYSDGIFKSLAAKLSFLLVAGILTFRCLTKYSHKHNRISIYPFIYRLSPDEKMLLIGSLINFPLYIATASINYKLSLLVLLFPASSFLLNSPYIATRTIGINILVLGLISLTLSMSPSYSPTLYVYKEWLIYFIVHPILFGTLSGIILAYGHMSVASKVPLRS